MKAKSKAIVNKTMLAKATSSHTILTLVIMVVLGGIQAFKPFMSQDLYVLINTILSAVAGYFKLNPSQKY